MTFIQAGNHRLQFIATVAALLLIFGCEGAEGPLGPEGPAGTDGVNGTDGMDGAANLEVVLLTITTSDFTDSGFVEIASYSVPQLTSNIASDGLVLAYTNLGTTSFWVALPLTLPVQGNTIVLFYAYRTGTIEIDITREAGPAVASVFSNHTIKVVMIEGISKRGLGVDLADHDAVMNAIGY